MSRQSVVQLYASLYSPSSFKHSAFLYRALRLSLHTSRARSQSSTPRSYSPCRAHDKMWKTWKELKRGAGSLLHKKLSHFRLTDSQSDQVWVCRNVNAVPKHYACTCPHNMLAALLFAETFVCWQSAESSENKCISPYCGRRRPGSHTGSPATHQGSGRRLPRRRMRRWGLQWTLSLPAPTLGLWTRRCPHRAGCTPAGWGSPGEEEEKEGSCKVSTVTACGTHAQVITVDLRIPAGC